MFRRFSLTGAPPHLYPSGVSVVAKRSPGQLPDRYVNSPGTRFKVVALVGQRSPVAHLDLVEGPIRNRGDRDREVAIAIGRELCPPDFVGGARPEVADCEQRIRLILHSDLGTLSKVAVAAQAGTRFRRELVQFVFRTRVPVIVCLGVVVTGAFASGVPSPPQPTAPSTSAITPARQVRTRRAYVVG